MITKSTTDCKKHTVLQQYRCGFADRALIKKLTLITATNVSTRKLLGAQSCCQKVAASPLQ